MSSDFVRVARLPRRPVEGWPEGAEQIEDVLRRPGATMTLRPAQRKALAELAIMGGLVSPIPVGGGKTLITYLASEMLDAQRPVLLVPAKLRDKTRRDFATYHESWVVRREPTILSYEMLGHPQHADDLQQLAPDLILADEAHRLKNKRAAVTRRLARWMTEHPDTRFVALSGTMTSRSLYDFAVLTDWSLGDNAPVPRTWRVLTDWARALDEDTRWEEPLAPGVLLQFCDGSERGTPTERARIAYRRRFAETSGVVTTTDTGVAASLVLSPWDAPPLPPSVLSVVRYMRDRWEMPDGQQIEQASDLWRHARELAQGFWYRWRVPAPEDWLDARREWGRFVRETLAHSRTLDSPAQVANTYKDDPIYRHWREIRDSFTPETEPVWLDESIIDAAIAWARRTGGLVWCEHRAVGEKFSEKGLTYFGAGGIDNRGRAIEDHDGPAALSIAANSEGRNLQKWSANLVLSPPTTGKAWEQLLGRTHRAGQKADEVTCEIYLTMPEARDGFEQAISDARYQQQLLGFPQKLMLADRT